jgi:MerR family transcriptional regulator, light-induced transcriptional regulator
LSYLAPLINHHTRVFFTVYIRAKKVKGTQYGYLVESIWDAKKKTSRQVTLKYLGKLDDITLDDLPEKYRKDQKIIAFLTSHSYTNIKETERLLKRLRQETFDYLTNGDLESLLRIYDTHVNLFGIVEFCEKILKHAMYQIGDLWEKKQLAIAAEHIASNVAHSFVKILNEKLAKPPTKQKILICTPAGESHNLGCNVLESYLRSRAFSVFNISPSVPSDEIIRTIKENSPNVILVSITLDENIQTGKKLVKKIREKFSIPVFVGGRALLDKKNQGFDATEAQDLNMSELARMLSTV